MVSYYFFRLTACAVLRQPELLAKKWFLAWRLDISVPGPAGDASVASVAAAGVDSAPWLGYYCATCAALAGEPAGTRMRRCLRTPSWNAGWKGKHIILIHTAGKARVAGARRRLRRAVAQLPAIAGVRGRLAARGAGGGGGVVSLREQNATADIRRMAALAGATPPTNEISSRPIRTKWWSTSPFKGCAASAAVAAMRDEHWLVATCEAASCVRKEQLRWRVSFGRFQVVLCRVEDTWACTKPREYQWNVDLRTSDTVQYVPVEDFIWGFHHPQIRANPDI